MGRRSRYFSVLGQLSVTVDGRQVRLAPKQRVLLAALLLRAGRPVGLDVLSERLWGSDLPAGPRAALQLYVNRLRAALGDEGELIRTCEDGYLIQIAEDEFDLAKVRALAAEADQIGGADAEREAALLHQALDLWGKDPLPGTGLDALASEELPALTEFRLELLECRLDADLRLGRHAGLVPELRTLTGAHPLREGLWERLILALYRSGRQADALAEYEKVRRLLADELGLDPRQELRDLQAAVLAADPALNAPEVEPQSSWLVQCQLPLEVPHFTGRADLGVSIAKSLAEETETVRIITVSGPPGVGKTSLAIQVAHRIIADFPDGQWYLHLAGASRPRTSESLLADLLGASGLAPKQLPEGVPARAALLRSRLAGRRVLLLLDDAATADQVRPLLPGRPGSAALITSRRALSGLAALDGAHRIALPELEPDESANLLGGLMANRADHRDQLKDLADLCGHLPLALRIVAANLAARPAVPLAAHLETLRKAGLAGMTIAGDSDTTVHRAFDSAYRALPERAAHLFRRLGLVPGPDFTAQAAADLLGSPRQQAQLLLDVLSEASLVHEYVPERYRLHDLLRVYAGELAEDDPDRSEARTRLYWGYLHQATAALHAMGPHVLQLPLPLTEEQAAMDRDAAIAWLSAEQSNLVAAAVAAKGQETSFYLADRLTGYFAYVGFFDGWAEAIAAGLASAEETGNVLGRATMNRAEGVRLSYCGQTVAARDWMLKALPDYRDVGNTRGETSVLNHLGISAALRSKMSEAVSWFQQAAHAARSGSHQAAAAMAIGNAAAALRELGRHEEAMVSLAEARTISQLVGEDPGDSTLLHQQATIEQSRGRLEAARTLITEEITAVRRRGRRHGLAMSLETLAAIDRDAGDFVAAERTALEALEVAESIGNTRIEGHIQVTLAEALQGQQLLVDAIDRYHAALVLAEPTGTKEVEVRALAGLATCHLSIGDPDYADTAARRAVAAAAETDVPFLHAAARSALDTVLAECPQA